MCKRTKHEYHSTQAQRRKPMTEQIRAQNKWRTSPKSNQTNSNLCDITMGQVHEITRGSPTKLDSRWPTQGAGAPLVACLEPNLARSVHTASPRMVHRVMARFNVLRMSVCTFHEGRKHFSKTPSSPPIKGGHPLLISTTHKRAQRHQRARARAPLHGLRP